MDHFQKGDVLLAVNGTSLLGLSHPEAVAQVKANTGSRVVTLRVVEAPETCVGPGNFVPSWLYWQQLPRWASFTSLHFPRAGSHFLNQRFVAAKSL